MLYPIELLLAEVHEKLDAPLSDDVRFLLATMEDKLRKPQLEAEGWFVACFSEDNDDLSQWRAYGGGEGGYAIGFNSLHLRKLGNQFMLLGKVEYDTTKHKAFIAELLNQTIGRPRCLAYGSKPGRRPRTRSTAACGSAP